MAKATVQSLMLKQIESINSKLDILIPEVAGLKVKAAIAGGLAGIVGTGVLTMILTAFKQHG